MRILSRTGKFVALIALSVLAAACPGDPPPNIPTSLSPQTVSGVEIDGPDVLAPGQSAQDTATLSLSSFVSKLPVKVSWIASPPSFVQINQAGLATGGQVYGGAAVTADVTLPSGAVVRKSKSVLNMPEGTFTLFGTITDAELHPLPIPGALVEVIAGKVEGITDSNGFFRLYGVPPSAEVRITATGYQPLAQNVELFTHSTQDFRLALSGPRLTLNGFYTLTIDGGAGCTGGPPLPADLRTRHYEATVTQTGQTVDVTLTESRFAVAGGAGNRFSGRVSTSGATFTLAAYYLNGEYPSIAERLPNGTYLVTEGAVETTRSGTGLSGTVFGWITNYVSSFPFSVADHGWCDNPRFTLMPR
jgi:hypothetical protein